jgi:hypothetical protein
MSFIPKHFKLLIVAASCALIGAGAGVIASAGASTSSSTATATAHPARGWLRDRHLVRRAVHVDLVVATKSGLVTVTFDRGVVQSLNGQQLRVTEGTKTQTYKTVTLTIRSGARVRDNGGQATLADVKTGQRVLVIQGPKQTYVIARTPRTP